MYFTTSRNHTGTKYNTNIGVQKKNNVKIVEIQQSIECNKKETQIYQIKGRRLKEMSLFKYRTKRENIYRTILKNDKTYKPTTWNNKNILQLISHVRAQKSF